VNFQANRDGVISCVKEGLLEIGEMQEFQVIHLVELLAEEIRKRARIEVATTDDFKMIHRASRMCYELLQDKQLTMIDKVDAQILYDLPLNERGEWLNRILNRVRFGLREVDVSIVVADHFAKSVEMIHVG
jgi:hypothetical protein